MIREKAEEKSIDILYELVVVAEKENALFYSWEDLSKRTQEDFISWCESEMQVSHGECTDGWAGGWKKYRTRYIDSLGGKR